jgi:hypothetical protein
MLPCIPNHRRDPIEASTLRRTPSTLAGDELEEPILEGPDNNRLNDAMLADGARQFIQGSLIEALAGLMGVRKDTIDIDFS